MDVASVDGVTTVRIDNPPVNAFDFELVEDAVATVRSIAGPIVLAGAGSCFTAGVDLDATVRAIWKSAETRATISAFLDTLK
jgi:enoyl-CoA hydratase